MSQSNGLRANCPRQHSGLRGLALGCALLLSACERDPEDNLLPAAVPDGHTQGTAADTSGASASTAGQRTQGLSSGAPGPGAGPSGEVFGVSAEELLSYHGRGYVRGFEGRPYPPVPDRQSPGNAASLNLADTPLANMNGPDQAAPLAGASRQPDEP